MLKCVSPFQSSNGKFLPGDVIEDPALEQAVKNESPESFVVVESREQAEEVPVKPRVRSVKK